MSRMSAEAGASRAQSVRGGVLYPQRYLWFVLVSSLDLMLTNTMLNYFGAVEVNTIAQRVIDAWGFWGLIGMKFGVVVLVVGICEIVGRQRERAGRRLASIAIGLSALPVLLALAQVALTLA